MLVVLLGLGQPLEEQAPPPVAPVVAELPPFDDWLAGVREEAAALGIRQETIDLALTGLAPVPQILERDRTQAEFTLDLEQYLGRRLTRPMLRMAQQMYTRHRAVLQKVGRTYDIDPRIVVSIWALESNFGRFAGVRPTIPTLATLAYDPRRGPLFRRELFSALRILDNGDVTLDELRGSWAGAIGQPQFLPSSYLQYAQDFDGDGRRDIWRSLPDVFASIAYYLKAHGWTEGVTWGRQVRVPKAAEQEMLALPRRQEGCRAVRLMTPPRPLAEWRKRGVLTASGAPLPRAGIEASLFQSGTRAYLLYGNYEALLGYNCAHSYALSVGHLADALR